MERIFVARRNAVLPLPPTTPPFTSPFPVQLSGGGTIDPLATLHVNLRRERDGVLLSAVVNWSATFTPPGTASALTVPGFVDVTFEIMRDGIVISTVTQTAVQKGTPLEQSLLFATAVPTFEIASLLHLDIGPGAFGCGCRRDFVYTLRATNVLLFAPQVAAGTATVSAQVGAVTFAAQEMAAVC